MSTVTESSNTTAPLELGGGLQTATNTIDYTQTLNFVLYKRLVLPIDGYVFWVNASLLNPNVNLNATFNKNPLNTTELNESFLADLTPLEEWKLSFEAQGSLHYSQAIKQDEDKTVTTQHAVFTSMFEVEQLGAINPDEKYITILPNGALLAFSMQSQRFYQAGLWHYSGNALFSTETTQVINNLEDLNPLQIVSNSLPFWLRMSTPSLPVYPSFLSPLNLNPPYVTADIRNTRGWGMAPLYTLTLSQTQICAEDVHFTFWGCNNDAVLDFQLRLLDRSYFGEYGISSIVVPIDDKLPQDEFQIIAQKKRMILSTNYYQFRVRDIAQQLIKTALLNYTVGAQPNFIN
jgi:hypothetical protein